jgi:hypothetical protein
MISKNVSNVTMMYHMSSYFCSCVGVQRSFLGGFNTFGRPEKIASRSVRQKVSLGTVAKLPSSSSSLAVAGCKTSFAIAITDRCLLATKQALHEPVYILIFFVLNAHHIFLYFTFCERLNDHKIFTVKKPYFQRQRFSAVKTGLKAGRDFCLKLTFPPLPAQLILLSSMLLIPLQKCEDYVYIDVT